MFLSLNLIGCVPQMENVDSDNLTASSVNAEALLSKTSAGQESLAYLNQLRASGFNVQYQAISEAEMLALNGHNGGGIRRKENEITIYFNNTLDDREKAHVIAHELVHVADGFAIDEYSQNHFYVEAAAKDFVANYKKYGIEAFDRKVVAYTLGSLFCSEVKAYTKNQNLSDQGFSVGNFAKGSGLSQFIDRNYIQRFGTSYGASADQMKTWCLSRGSMSAIQSSLGW